MAERGEKRKGTESGRGRESEFGNKERVHYKSSGTLPFYGRQAVEISMFCSLQIIFLNALSSDKPHCCYIHSITLTKRAEKKRSCLRRGIHDGPDPHKCKCDLIRRGGTGQDAGRGAGRGVGHAEGGEDFPLRLHAHHH